MTPFSDVMVTCSVCRFMDGDLTPKRCKYCPKCKAWLCERDHKHTMDALKRRALSAVGPIWDAIGPRPEV